MNRILARIGKLKLMWAISLLVAIACIYYPSLLTGFFADDYNFLEPVVRLSLGDYLIYYFDPRVQVLWYRPLQGLLVLVEFKLFGVNPAPYHIVQILIHWINSLLLFLVVDRISGKPRLAMLSTLLYASFPVYALAVNWINITDPLMTVFYLLAIWFWWSYLKIGRRRDFVIAHIMFVLALLTKQMAVSLPIILFALDRLAAKDHATISQLVRRYGLLFLILAGYMVLQYSIGSTHTYASVFSYSFGIVIASILLQYFSLMTFPWGYFPPTDTQITEGLPFVAWGNIVWLLIASALYLGVVIRTRNTALIFLCGSILVTLGPILLFPFVELRYLYLPGMAAAILFALGSDAVFRRLYYPAWSRMFVSVALALLMLGSGLSVASANAGIFEIARQRRVPFRDIALRHPVFPEDTYLYFVYPVSPVYELSGMFTLRYGPGVIIGGTGRPQPSYLHSHKNAFVYYFDDTGAPHELVVAPMTSAALTPSVPASFDRMIDLENIELARTDASRGGAMVVIFYWRAAARIDKNYTVFAHLLDKNGNVVAGYDAQPGRGELPTLNWRLNQKVVDAITLSIPEDAPLGDGYRLEVGLYDLKTLQRLQIVNEKGNSLADRLVVEPLSLVQ